jgi:hypothetical protein
MGPHPLMVGFYYFIAMNQFKVVCINDKFRPVEFPAELWIKKDQIYTVSKAVHLAKQHMSIGYKLNEIKIPEDCKYQYFISNRFRPIDQDDEEAEKALEQLLLEIEEYA